MYFQKSTFTTQMVKNICKQTAWISKNPTLNDFPIHFLLELCQKIVNFLLGAAVWLHHLDCHFLEACIRWSKKRQIRLGSQALVELQSYESAVIFGCLKVPKVACDSIRCHLYRIIYKVQHWELLDSQQLYNIADPLKPWT